MNTLSSDEDILQLFPDKDEVMDGLMDFSYLNNESLFLKFFSKNQNLMENQISEVIKLVLENHVQIKGTYFKGLFSVSKSF